MKLEFTQVARLDGDDLLYPLQCSTGRWEWHAWDPESPYCVPYDLPQSLFPFLPGHDPTKFCVSYPTLEDAFKALEEAVCKFNLQEQT